MNTHKSEDGMIGDYCDGQQFQEHPLFQEDPCALQIRIYYDDVEFCNALGSKVKKHKLGKNSIIIVLWANQFCWTNYKPVRLMCIHVGLFYYSLGNIEPKYRSTCHSIQLLAVVRTNLIDKYGINEILKPLMDSIKQLENVR